MRRLHLAAGHPLAGVAANHCARHSAPLVGGIACGHCWERAIRDDERFATENELPRELVIDPGLVDEVAVARAVLGHVVPLTTTERRVAIARLRAQGRRLNEISRLLHTNHTTVSRELQRLGAMSAGAA
jgi:hypothetical protein